MGGVVRRITYQTGLHIGDKKIKDFEFQLLSIYSTKYKRATLHTSPINMD